CASASYTRFWPGRWQTMPGPAFCSPTARTGVLRCRRVMENRVAANLNLSRWPRLDRDLNRKRRMAKRGFNRFGLLAHLSRPEKLENEFCLPAVPQSEMPGKIA